MSESNSGAPAAPPGTGAPTIITPSGVAPQTPVAPPAAPPPPANPLTAPPAAPATVAAAQSEIARLVKGGDPQWLDAYRKGEPAAVERMSRLQQAANPEPTTSNVTMDPDGGVNVGGSRPTSDGGLEHSADALSAGAPLFEFDPSTSAAHMAQINAAGREAIQLMGVPHDMARGMISTLEKSINQRTVVGRDGQRAMTPMSEVETRQWDFMLRQQWGRDYAAKLNAAGTALRSAGKYAPWIKNAMRHAGPQTAALISASLANHGERILAAAAARR